MKNKSALQSFLICLFAALAFVAYTSPAHADTTTWTGASDGNWFNPLNWDNGVPTFFTDAFINNGDKVQINVPGATARTLTIGASAGDSGTLSIDGTTGGTLVVGGSPRPCQTAPVPGALQS